MVRKGVTTEWHCRDLLGASVVCEINESADLKHVDAWKKAGYVQEACCDKNSLHPAWTNVASVDETLTHLCDAAKCAGIQNMKEFHVSGHGNNSGVYYGDHSSHFGDGGLSPQQIAKLRGCLSGDGGTVYLDGCSTGLYDGEVQRFANQLVRRVCGCRDQSGSGPCTAGYNCKDPQPWENR